MKTYQILEPNDILQKGDEFLSSLMPPAWSLSTQVGEKASGILYRRPVIEKEYRILEQVEASLPTDEWWSPYFGWVVGSSHNTNVRRRLISGGAPTSVGLDLNRIKQPQNELLSQSSDLKRRLENALSDKILLQANLSDRNAAINRLKERIEEHVSVIEDKNDTIRRLSEKLEAVVGASEKCIQDKSATVEQLKEHRKTQEEQFEVVIKALLADTQFYRRVIDKLTQDGPEEV